MKEVPTTFWEYLSTPFHTRTRVLLVLLAIPLVLTFWFPLWNITMIAPQYPAGLELEIYSWKLEGGREGRDLAEINILNHYIGMQKIAREELRDLDWIPPVIGIVILLVLRTAAIGNVRSLIDMAVIGIYLSLLAFGRFIYMLHRFGSDLDPAAPMDVEPFMPAVFGKKQIANFTTWSLPGFGSYMLFTFVFGVAALALYELWRGRRDFLAQQVTRVVGG